MPPQPSSNSSVGGGGAGPGQGPPVKRYVGGSGSSTGGSESKPINGWQSNKDMEARRDMIQNM